MAQARRQDARIPPHNVDAEASIIGAALLNRDAAALCAGVPASDFYKPQHRHIVDAIRRIVDAGGAVDTVTVGEELRRVGALGEVGGAEAIHELQNAVPSISSAGHYARIVQDAAALRRLLYVASDISEIAYTSTDPAAALLAVSGIVDRIGAAVDTSTISTLEVADIAAILATDLEPEQPTLLTRSDGGALLYAGKMHMFQAEPTAGKSWIACVACVEAITMGGSALWVDFEDTSRGIISRLLQLGLDPALLAARFRYVQPVGAFGAPERVHLDGIIADLNPDVVIIDGVGEALSRDGLSEDKAADVVGWIEKLPRPIARTGAAVVMIDHVVKDREQQGRWARGSGAKLGVIDGCSYQLKVLTPFAREKAGKVRMVIAKDRPGGVGALNETAAVFTITPHGGGARVVIDVDPYTAELHTGDAWKPTHIMARVSTVIAESDIALTATGIKAMLPNSKPNLVQQAITRLAAEGYITKGNGKTKTYTSVRPYTDPEAASHPHAPPPLTDDDAPPDYSDEALFSDWTPPS